MIGEALGNAAQALGEGLGAEAEAFVVVEQSAEAVRKLGGGFDDGDGLGGEKLLLDGREVLHVGPCENGLAERGGFENVVAAPAAEAAADENDASVGVKRAEFAERVEEKNAAPVVGELGTKREGQAAGADFLRDGGEALRLARGE